MNDSSDYRPVRSPGAVAVGLILLVAAILLGLVGLPMALEDPCSGISGCVPLVDMRAVGWMIVAFALLIGLPGAWMAHWGSRPASD